MTRPRRGTSDVREELSDMGLDSNPNANFMNSKGFWALYVSLIVFLRLIVNVFFPHSSGKAWFVTSLAHNTLSFVLLHWIKGSPFPEIYDQQGKFASLTLWEQLTGGMQYTPVRKFLTIVHVVLFLITINIPDDLSTLQFCIVTASFLPGFIGKMPSMHKVRLFGINKD